jgi:hypothetical protein
LTVKQNFQTLFNLHWIGVIGSLAGAIAIGQGTMTAAEVAPAAVPSRSDALQLPQAAESTAVPSRSDALQLPQAAESTAGVASSPPITPLTVSEQRDRSAIPSVSELAAPSPDPAMAQVTSVSQLTDVKPTDWAFQALQSLVERYGCIVGYPDRTYRGNQALTRFEFAAGLNACLDRVSELIAAATDDLVRKEDLETLRKLQEEFAAELATLRGRVDALEARTATLEKQQFSTTTKLNGEVIIAAGAGFGGDPDDGEDGQPFLVNRVRLNLLTSFSGKDLLITGLQAYNFQGAPLDGGNSLQGTLFPNQALLTQGMSKLSFEPQFPGFDPKDLSTQGANSVNLYKLLYVFPSGLRNLTLFAGTAAESTDAFPTVTPFYGEGTEAISRFAGLNPVLRVSGATSQTGLASAFGFIWAISDQIDLRALYGSVNANLPQEGAEVLPGVSGTPLGAGLFGGSSVVATQLTFRPTKTIDVALTYAHSYHEINILGTDLASASANALGGLPLGVPVRLDSIGGTLTWRFTPNIAFTTYGAWMFVNDQTGDFDASSKFSSWMAGFHFKDLGLKGSSAGILFGQPLYRYSADGDARRLSSAVPYHLEAYYRIRVNDNISITPGAFVLFNPEADEDNDTTTIGIIRTTFTF